MCGRATRRRTLSSRTTSTTKRREEPAVASEDERISTALRLEAAQAGRPTGTTDGEHMRVLYSERFGGDEAFRRAMWQVLAERFFQRYVPAGSVLVDIAAGGCEFVNAIKARERIAVDVNPAVATAAGPGVRAIVGPAHDMADLADAIAGVSFQSLKSCIKT